MLSSKNIEYDWIQGISLDVSLMITFFYFMTDSSAHCDVIPKYNSVSGFRVRLTVYKMFNAKQERAILATSLLNGIVQVTKN